MKILTLVTSTVTSAILLTTIGCSGAGEVGSGDGAYDTASEALSISDVLKDAGYAFPDAGAPCLSRRIQMIGCGEKVLRWKALHTKLVNAMIQAQVPIDRSTLVESSTVSLASSQTSKDLGYRIRGLLEEINSDATALGKLKTVLSELPASGMVALPRMTRHSPICNGEAQPTEGGRPVILSLFEGTGTYAVGGTCDTPPYKAIVPFERVGNQYVVLNTSSSSSSGASYYGTGGTTGANISITYQIDPQTSPDGFGATSSSGSCTSYGTQAISTDASDGRFANGGLCDRDTGSSCAACNLDGESGCTSRVVWRRVGSTSAWRCRAT